MRYLGGKMRQAPQIVAAVRSLHPQFKTYVEPFCGAMWSAVAVMKAFPDRAYVLSDINPYLIAMWKAGIDGWNPPSNPTEADHRWYNKNRPANDPMTAYLGFAWSFAGQFFNCPARTNGKFSGSYSTTLKKIQQLRKVNVKLYCRDFQKVNCSESMVYLDPPYEGRNPQSKNNTPLDYNMYSDYATKLAKNNKVIATSFDNKNGWKVLHDYGDTVIRHYAGQGSDGTRELLLKVTG